MKLAAITGSIGCGKTTLSKIVRRLGYVVYDIDGWVRRLYYQKDFIKVIAAHFPEVMEGEKVNKRKLRNLVFGDNARLKVLESLIHPFLKQTLMNVRRRNARRADLFFMDVALLFEMGWDKYCDYIVVADVDYETQKMRVMRRDNISAADFDKINRIQMDNAAKKVLADVIIDTDKPINLLKVELLAMIEEIEGC
jgi:dephospho-coA kinase